MESIDVIVLGDEAVPVPVEGVIVRVFDSTGTHFITSGTTDAQGQVGFLLVATQYQVRLFKDKFSIQQPQILDVKAAESNVFELTGHRFVPPEAVHPRLCRCHGFFKRPNGSPAPGHDIHIIAKFDPILLEGDAVLTERVHTRTDQAGYMQVDLIRCGQYEVTIEGFEDCLRIITVPDASSVNLPDLLFPVVERIEFDLPTPWSLGIGQPNEVYVKPAVHTTDRRILPGVAIMDVYWATEDPNVAVVLPAADTLTIRGLSAGSTKLTAVRADRSIIRIPDLAIQGVPVDIVVS